MIRRVSQRLAAWVLRLGVPAAWRDSIAGDVAEDGPDALGVFGAIALVSRLRLASRPQPSPEREGARWASFASGVSSDVRSALRGLVKQPGQTAAVVATLAIGIGANVSVFSLANQWLLRPIPGVVDERRLVTVTFGKDDGTSTRFSGPAVAALRAGVSAFSRLTAYGETAVHVAIAGRVPERLTAQVVSADFFETLGEPVGIGRGFAADEYVDPGAPPAVVVSDRIWREQLGASLDAIGRHVVIDGEAWTVVGVTTPGFRGASRNSAADLWVPLGQFPRIWRWLKPGDDGFEAMTDPNNRVFLAVVGRLAQGASVDGARGQVESVRARLAAALPTHSQLNHFRFLVRAGLREGIWTESQLTRASGLLFGIVTLLLVLTAANVSSLALARTASRRMELATRTALGASRAAIARLVMIEMTMLAAVAGVVSIGVAMLTGGLLQGTVVIQGLPPLGAASMDWRIAGVALAISGAAAIMGGLVPAVAASRAGLMTKLRRGGRTVSESRRWGRALMAVQVAISLMLMVASLLLARSMAERWSVDPGFDPSRVLTFSTDPSTQGYDLARKRAFTAALLERLRALPGVRAAASAWPPPLTNSRREGRFLADSAAPPEVTALSIGVSSGYFAALGVRFVEGRDFRSTEVVPLHGAADPPVIISQSLARSLFGPGSAVGRRIVGAPAAARTQVVVGVAPDLRQMTITEPAESMVFDTASMGLGTPVTIVVGTDAPASAMLPRVREVVGSLDPVLPIYDARTLEGAIGADLAQDALVMRLATIFAVLATVLAAVGLWGVLARGVAERRRELSIRVALGASPAAIGRSIAADAWRVGLPGIAGGLIATLWLSRYLQSWLFGITRFDPLAMAGALTLVAAVIGTSVVGPARRAATIDCASELK
ncbi:MAG TPA: ADOP family duplicated permease [Vicinamibacterales bacterium]|nr:ADOP family duplicated permease [Vicinamibacterales bacterium]